MLINRLIKLTLLFIMFMSSLAFGGTINIPSTLTCEGPKTCKWDLDYDGEYEKENNCQIDHTFTNLSQDKIKVEVSCDHQTETITLPIKVWKPTWDIGSTWSSCSNHCGSGTQTKTVKCKREDGLYLSDSYCSETKPVVSQSCTDYSGCSYTWYIGNWSSCSNHCGYGTQTRTVYCKRSDGMTVSDSYCSGSKPVVSQSCTDYSGCSYTWYIGNWSSCSASYNCGYGIQTRTVYCKRSDGMTVSDLYCSGSKPSTSQSCYAGSICGYAYCTERDWPNQPYGCGGPSNNTWIFSGAAGSGPSCAKGVVSNQVYGVGGITGFQCIYK